MRFFVLKALTRGVVIDSVRRKDLWVVAILGLLILLSASLLGFFGLDGLQSFVKDLATSVLGIFTTIIAVLVSGRMMPDEIKNRTLYPLLARPISRWELLVGKWLGAVAVTWISFGLLLVTTSLALALFRVPFEPVMLQYIFLKMIGLAMLCSVTLLLSLLMTPAGACVMSLILAAGTGMIVRAMTMAFEFASPPVQFLFKVLNGLLPQYSLFDVGDRAANSGWGPAPLWVVGALLGYAGVYSLAMLVLSWARFRRQAI